MDRAQCQDCERESPYENYGWICTHGPGCIEQTKKAKPMPPIFATLATQTTTDDLGICIAFECYSGMYVERRSPANPAYITTVDKTDPSNLLIQTSDGAAYRVSIVRV